MPSTACMTPDGRCPPPPEGAAERRRGPIERAVRDRPSARDAICDQARRDVAAAGAALERTCWVDADCELLDVGECGTPARRATVASELFAQWRDYLRVCDSGVTVDCTSIEVICFRRRCDFAPPRRD